MNLSPGALTTLETVKAHLGIASGETASDNRLIFLVNGFSELFQNYTGRKFAKGTFTEKLDGDCSEKIYLQTLPILSVSEIKLNGIVVSAGGYVVYGDEGSVFYKNGVWPEGNQNIEVTFTGGYILPKDESEEHPRTLPFDIEMACVKGVGKLFNKAESEGVKNSSSGSMSVNFQDALDTEISQILDLYTNFDV